jgi:TolB protein
MAHALVIAEHAGTVARLERTEAGWVRRELGKGLWPTAQPGGGLVAASRVEVARGEILSEVTLYGREGEAPEAAHQVVRGAPPIIAPRVPHYVMWSPLGDTIAIAAAASEGITLYLSDAGGAYRSDAVATGAPLFSSWSAGGDQLAIHTGNDLFVYWPGSRRKEPVSSRAVGFRTPAWAGSKVIYAEPAHSGVSLKVHDASSGEPLELPGFRGGVALVPCRARPGLLAVAVAADANTGLFNELWLVDVEQGRTLEKLHSGPFVAAWWPPPGASLAVLVPTQSGDGQYRVHLVSLEGRMLATSDSFVPAQDFRTLLGFFDQYAQSHELWSPDGAALLLTGRLGGDAVAASFADGPRDYVMLWEARKGGRLEIVGRGDLAFFAAE